MVNEGQQQNEMGPTSVTNIASGATNSNASSNSNDT